MWSTGPVLDENFKKRAEMFNAAHAGRYEVDLQILPWDQYWPKVDLGYASKQPFDVYAWDVQAYGHYKAGLVRNIQEDVNMVAGLTDKDQYPLDLMDVWRFDGTNLYALPDNIQMLALYYNKDMFDKAGLSYPDETWTWDNMLEAARKMTIVEGDTPTQWGMDVGDLTAWWGTQTLAWAMGGSFFDKIVEPTKFTVSEPATVQAIKFIQDLMFTEKIAPDGVQRQAAAQDVNIFLTGKVGMYPGGTWFISSCKDAAFKWDIAPMPKWQDKRALAFWFGGWVVAKDSKYPEAATAFATWSATEYQQTLAETKDWIPIRRDARESAKMQEGMPSGFQSVMKTLPDARLGDLYHRNSQQIISEVLFPTFDLVWNNKLTPEEAAKQIDEKANELLNKA
jgi:multiple sugar transport system substrate-binding protein